MWEGKRVYNGFFQFFNDGVKTANICKALASDIKHAIETHLTIKRNRNLFRRNNLHGYCLLVRIEIEILYPRPPTP